MPSPQKNLMIVADDTLTHHSISTIEMIPVTPKGIKKN